MLITPKGIIMLRKLRIELQDEARDAFPQAVLKEMLVLYDVCKCLELNIFQCQEVLGESGWRGINTYIDSPIGAYPATEFGSSTPVMVLQM